MGWLQLLGREDTPCSGLVGVQRGRGRGAQESRWQLGPGHHWDITVGPEGVDGLTRLTIDVWSL